jgi:hypothetical protein
VNKTITADQAEQILDALSELGGSVGDDPINIGYHGRGMYGQKCFGFVLESGTSALLLGMALQKALGEDDEDIASALGYAARSDALGTAEIHYFPGWNIAEDDDPQEVGQ